MAQHVAMQKPFARIVEHAQDIAALPAHQKRSVAQRAWAAILFQLVDMVAPTRAGKGVGFVIPNLLSFAGSVVVLDVKGENFDNHAAVLFVQGML